MSALTEPLGTSEGPAGCHSYRLPLRPCRATQRMWAERGTPGSRARKGSADGAPGLACVVGVVRPVEDPRSSSSRISASLRGAYPLWPKVTGAAQEPYSGCGRRLLRDNRVEGIRQHLTECAMRITARTRGDRFASSRHGSMSNRKRGHDGGKKLRSGCRLRAREE